CRGAGFFFFLQAEDGIRDWSVTGVQTCALPIFRGALRLETLHEFDARVLGQLLKNPAEALVREVAHDVGAALRLHLLDEIREIRSEERRVGKECRSGWAAGQ